MSYDYSENILVQGAAGDLLHDELGWDLVYAHNQETLGPNGMLGRTDYREVLLTKYLRPALFRLNSWMTEAYADSVVKSLLETSFSATPMQTNELMISVCQTAIWRNVWLVSSTLTIRPTTTFLP